MLAAIVGDEAVLREAIKRLIRPAGFAAETLASAEEFLRSEHQHSAGCAIREVRLPGHG